MNKTFWAESVKQIERTDSSFLQLTRYASNFFWLLSNKSFWPFRASCVITFATVPSETFDMAIAKFFEAALTYVETKTMGATKTQTNWRNRQKIPNWFFQAIFLPASNLLSLFRPFFSKLHQCIVASLKFSMISYWKLSDLGNWVCQLRCFRSM